MVVDAATPAAVDWMIDPTEYDPVERFSVGEVEQPELPASTPDQYSMLSYEQIS